MNNTNTAVAKQVTTQPKASALSVMANRFSVDPAKLLTTLKNTVFKGASDDECMALVIVANEYNLNPLKKEIYAFKGKDGGIVAVIGVDGWINIMNSNEKFDGVEFEMEQDGNGKPLSCACSIHIKDRTRPVKVTEYFEECQRNTDPWKQMPRRMLRNRALAQCVRVAFTVGGVVDEDEAQAFIADPVANAKPVNATVTSDPAPKARKEGLPSKKDSLGAWMTEHSYTWSQIQPILAENDVIQNADSIASFDELTEDQATAIFGARTGLQAVLSAGGKQ